jgi:hypothetical protein
MPAAMWNNRVTLTVLASLIGLLLICAGLGAAYAPYYTGRRDTRLTQIAQGFLDATSTVTAAVAQTQIAFQPTQTAVAGATQTEIARPTITPTPTNTPTPTFTPTATQPAAVVGCPASVVGTGQRMYSVPGGGRLKNSVLLPNGTSVTLIGRLRDGGWYQVKTDSNQIGWMRSDVLALAGGDCQANTYDLSYLLGLTTGQRVVADDTFVSNENGWTNAAGKAVSPVLSAYADAQLVLSTSGVDRLTASNPALKHVPDFHLVTSFSRENFFSDSYVGVRFRDSGLTYYEVRILRDCRIVVLAVNQSIFTRPVEPGANTCTDDLEDWLVVSLTPDDHLTIQLNDAEPVDVVLQDPSGLYTGGGLELVVAKARVTISYLVVTAPQ